MRQVVPLPSQHLVWTLGQVTPRSQPVRQVLCSLTPRYPSLLTHSPLLSQPWPPSWQARQSALHAGLTGGLCMQSSAMTGLP